MESLRNLARRKKMRENCKDGSWESLCGAWDKLLQYQTVSPWPQDKPLYQSSPWWEWCEKWDKFRSSGNKTPKSGKKKAAMWEGLYCVGRKTLESLKINYLAFEASHKERMQLKQCNQALEKELHEERQAHQVTKTSMAIQTQKMSITENKLMTSIDTLENKINELKKENRELEGKVIRLQIKCTEYCEKYETPDLSDSDEYPTLTAEEVDKIAGKIGSLTSKTVMDWLYKCELETEVENLTERDVIRLLSKCAHPSVYHALHGKFRETAFSWIQTCAHIVECLKPDTNIRCIFLHDKMRVFETASQFFDRLWLEFRILHLGENVTRENIEYKSRICTGLHPELEDQISPHMNLFSPYNIIQINVFSADNAWKEHQRRLQMTRPETVGFPLRREVWMRLKKYEDPRKTVDGHPYWNLLVRLSRYEDLDTQMPRLINT